MLSTYYPLASPAIACSLICFSSLLCYVSFFFFFFFNDTATTEIYTLSLHDALPISPATTTTESASLPPRRSGHWSPRGPEDRKSTRLNSSHITISYAVFCLKKKKKKKNNT